MKKLPGYRVITRIPGIQLTPTIFFRREFSGCSGFLQKKSGSPGPVKFFGRKKNPEFIFRAGKNHPRSGRTGSTNSPKREPHTPSGTEYHTREHPGLSCTWHQSRTGQFQIQYSSRGLFADRVTVLVAPPDPLVDEPGTDPGIRIDKIPAVHDDRVLLSGQ